MEASSSSFPKDIQSSLSQTGPAQKAQTRHESGVNIKIVSLVRDLMAVKELKENEGLELGEHGNIIRSEDSNGEKERFALTMLSSRVKLIGALIAENVSKDSIPPSIDAKLLSLIDEIRICS